MNNPISVSYSNNLSPTFRRLKSKNTFQTDNNYSENDEEDPQENNKSVISDVPIDCLSKMEGFSHGNMVYYKFSKLKGEKLSPVIEKRRKRVKKEGNNAPSMSSVSSRNLEFKQYDNLYPTLPKIENRSMKALKSQKTLKNKSILLS